MASRSRIVIGLTVAGLAAAGILSPGEAWAQSAAEKLYADLAKLPAAERSARILEGARKEGQFKYIQTITGRDGKAHGDIFAKKYPFLKIEQSQMDSQDGSERIVVEESAGRHLTDLVSNAVPDLGQMIKMNLAAIYKTPMTDRVLPQYKSLLDAEGRFTPWYWSEHGLVYNSALLKGDQIPKSYMDLCKPHLKGKVSYDSAETRFMVGLWTIFDKDDKKLEEWMKCMGANQPVIQNGHTARMTLMLAGDHAASGDQYLYFGESQRRKAPDKNPFAIAFEAPIMAYAAGVAINKNAPNPYSAALFTDWTLDTDSQEYMAGLLRGPLSIPHPFIPPTADLVTFSFIDPAVSDRFHEMWIKYVGKSAK